MQLLDIEKWCWAGAVAAGEAGAVAGVLHGHGARWAQAGLHPPRQFQPARCHRHGEGRHTARGPHLPFYLPILLFLASECTW